MPPLANESFVELPPPPEIASISDLVTEGWKLDAQIKRDVERLKQIKAALVKAGAGRYPGLRGGEALVILPTAKIELPRDEAVVGELREKVLGKENFATLFERVVKWQPVKSCRAVAERVLTLPKLRKFLVLCEVECPAQVRFS